MSKELTKTILELDSEEKYRAAIGLYNILFTFELKGIKDFSARIDENAEFYESCEVCHETLHECSCDDFDEDFFDYDERDYN